MGRPYTSLKVLEITELTAEQLRQISEDRERCGSCEHCTMAYLSYKGEDLGGSCGSAERALVKGFADSVERYENKPIEQPVHIKVPEHKPSESSFYDSTKSFMKKSGYKKCYMCGAELGGDE